MIRLAVSRPFHHIMMAPAAERFRADLDKFDFMRPLFPVYLNVTGMPITDTAELRQRLYEQIFKPVQWTKTIQKMAEDDIETFYEISPKPVLTAFVRNIVGMTVETVYIQDVSSCL